MARVSVPRWSLYVLVIALVASLAFSFGALYAVSGANGDDTMYYACLYAGSLSQVGTSEPQNCGRGAPISWNAAGTQGIAGYEIVPTTPLDVAPGWSQFQIASCPDGKLVLGGGPGSSGSGLSVEDSRPNQNGTAWVVYMRNDSTDTLSFVAYAVCATATYVQP